MSTHRAIGSLAFWVTFIHIILSVLKWYPRHKADYWTYLWSKIWHYYKGKVSDRNRPDF